MTLAGLRLGMRAAVPLMIGLTPFGLVVGIVSQSKGLSLAETLLMSGVVYAGTAQLLAMELWADPAPLLAACLAAFAVNVRMLPMGAALAPLLDRVRGWRLWLTLGTIVDHSFALGVANMRSGGRDPGFLLGIGLTLWVTWMIFAALGHVLSGAIRLPPGHPIFFAATATFVALLVSLWRGKGELWPWVLAAGLALGAARLGLPQPVPLLSGALGGAALAAWLEGRRN
ncbi:azaleucine resistance protein AzlC [Pseudoroseomonas wenyumeiae]|uniref:Azaleucine resistance protein AzlC n=1 Tax=Teichococcus wenyumeiae TaxID=2478470 RepID=A0A3A9J7S9_9PROT|nr:AzlC family ABC transporter permease [Pseudoroseomonas wenyumeiae]RKK00773.1 azaleucine resistance protein AzlC [Pseudoroseomonas wenyumeiae]RMI27220.1 azaleucine resistance protein AzlC [Pseudoroseomonas wenyumeiae]